VRHPKLGNLRWWFSNPTGGKTVSHYTATMDVQQTIMGLAYSGVLLSVSPFRPLASSQICHILEGSMLRVGLHRKFADKRHVFERMLMRLNF
jgi:hypothetical protein